MSYTHTKYSTGTQQAVPSYPVQGTRRTGLNIHSLEKACEGSQDFQELMGRATSWLCDHSESLSFWLGGVDTKAAPIPLRTSNRVQWTEVQESAMPLWRNALSGTGETTVSSSRVPNRYLVVTPIRIQNQPQFVLFGLYETLETFPETCELLQEFVAHLVQGWFFGQELEQAQTQVDSVARQSLLYRAMSQTTKSTTLLLGFTNQFKRFANVSQVVIAKQVEGDWNLLSISDCDEINLKLESQRRLKSLISLPDASDAWKGIPADDSPVSEYMNQMRFQSMMVWDVCPNKRTQYRIAVFHTAERAGSKLEASWKDLTNSLAHRLEDLAERNDTAWQRKRKLVTDWLRTQKVMAGIVAGVVALGCLLIPYPYQIGCDVEIQPVVRRFVSAPFDGILEKSLVRQGDSIEQGQTLALLSREKLETKIAALEAEIAGAKLRADASRATGNIAESQIAKAEMKRSQADLTLVEQRLRDLEIKSPIDGVVVSGELENAQGAPLETGQVLFEIGPLEKMLVEIYVPENEISYVREGMKVNLCFNAYPLETFAGSVEAIHPKAKLVDDELVFIATVGLDNEAGKFRPGLRGTARIVGDWQPAGWNLFHGSYESVRRFLTW